MSVILNFAIFPIDQSEKMTPLVSKAIESVRDSGVAYRLNSMGTVIETNTMEEAFKVVNDAYRVIEPFSDRIYLTVNIDAKKGLESRMQEKVDDVEKNIGKVNT